MKKLRWESDMAKYANGNKAFLGKYQIGGTHWDGTVSRDDKETGPIRVNCLLPGIKSNLGNFHSEEEARELLTKAVNVWIENSNISMDREG